MDVNITEITCFNCGVVFWLTSEHQKKLVRCHNAFYCPNGHSQSYAGETDRQKLKRVEEQLASRKEYNKELERSNSALRGVITKKKKEQAEKKAKRTK